MSIIQTDRLTLRPLTMQDAPEVYARWTHDPQVAQYCRWAPHPNVETTKAWMAQLQAAADGGFDYRWGIELRADHTLIGMIDAVALSADGKTATIGYVLARNYWNHGYVTEALRAVIDRLFADGVQVVQAEHNVNNPASGRVMEKCGMVFTHFSKSQVKFDSDALCDVKWYEIRNPSEPGEQEGDRA